MENFMVGFKDFLNNWGLELISAVFVTIAGWLGTVAKNLITKWFNDKTKKEVARTVVEAIEQCYKLLDGPSKLQKAIEAATEMLNEKGIKITEVELRMLLESALAEFNKVFEKKNGVSKERENWVEATPEESITAE